MFRRVTSSLLVLAAASCSSQVQTPRSVSTQAAADGAAVAPASEKKECRDLSTTGSYGPRHACHTKSEWRKIDALS